MTMPARPCRLASRLARFHAETTGTVLVELAIVLPIFLLLLLGLIDFGRMGGEIVMADKAMQRAARIAAVRPAVCAGVPLVNARGSGATATTHYGTGCAAGANFCANPGVISCTGSAANGTAAEIWAAISPLMPSHATVGNLRFSYAYDANLGFLGGPYVPVVTVEIQNLNFQFATPLSALAALVGVTDSAAPGATLPFPKTSTTLPGEDLAAGNAG